MFCTQHLRCLGAKTSRILIFGAILNKGEQCTRTREKLCVPGCIVVLDKGRCCKPGNEPSTIIHVNCHALKGTYAQATSNVCRKGKTHYSTKTTPPGSDILSVACVSQHIGILNYKHSRYRPVADIISIPLKPPNPAGQPKSWSQSGVMPQLIPMTSPPNMSGLAVSALCMHHQRE